MRTLGVPAGPRSPSPPRPAVANERRKNSPVFVGMPPINQLAVRGEAFREPSYGNCFSSRPMSSIGPRIVQPGPRGRVERKPWASAYSSASSAVSSGARMIV